MLLEIGVVAFVPLLSFLLRNWDPRPLSVAPEMKQLREFVMQPLRSADTEEAYSAVVGQLSDSEEEDILENSDA